MTMHLTRPFKALLALFTAGVLAFIYIPLGVVVINSFSASESLTWPPPGFTTRWWEQAVGDSAIHSALLTSVGLAVVATSIALILGTLTAQALGRYAFFGRDVVSLLLILPLALPGIVTGIAFNNVFTTYLGGLSWVSLIVAHSTFTIVVVYNNAVARLRRLAPNVEEASMDLGATRTRTYWSITFPMLRSALLAGAVLAFGLSFDEIIVTTFTAGPGIETLPIWILTNLFRPGQGPLVAVVAAFLVIVSIGPIYLAQHLSRSDR
jgi:putative spermidine/putrescine transport system permease protein